MVSRVNSDRVREDLLETCRKFLLFFKLDIYALLGIVVYISLLCIVSILSRIVLLYESLFIILIVFLVLELYYGFKARKLASMLDH